MNFEDFPNSSGVYRIKNRISGDSYIGSGCNLQKRIRQHFWQMSNGSHHQQRMMELYYAHGANSFDCEVLELCDEAYEREAVWIGRLKPNLNRNSPPGTDCMVDKDAVSINTRIPSDLHKQLRIEAVTRGVSMQELVAEALRKLLGDKPPPRGK